MTHLFRTLFAAMLCLFCGTAYAAPARRVCAGQVAGQSARRRSPDGLEPRARECLPASARKRWRSSDSRPQMPRRRDYAGAGGLVHRSARAPCCADSGKLYAARTTTSTTRRNRYYRNGAREVPREARRQPRSPSTKWTVTSDQRAEARRHCTQRHRRSRAHVSQRAQLERGRKRRSDVQGGSTMR